MNNTVAYNKQSTDQIKSKHKNQISYIAEAAFEYFVSLLVTGAFLAAILKNIGVPDSVTGITTALASFGFSAQLFAVLFIKPKASVKRLVTILHLVNQLMFVSLYMIPFINIPHGVKVAVFVIMFLGGHFLTNTASPFKISWLMSYVDDDKRGKFTANKEIISLFGGMVFSYAMGAVIDHFNNIGNAQLGFTICGLTLFVLCILHLISLVVVKESPESSSPSAANESQTLKSVFKCTVFDKTFRKVILLDMLWHMGTGISVSYYGTYQINELGFSLKYVAVLSAVYSIIRIAFSRYFGRLADKYSWSKMLYFCFIIGAVSFLINTFTIPANGKVFFTLHYALYALYLAGANSGIMNITFDYVSKENRACALGVKSAIGGIFGFLASLVGGEIVNLVQANNNIVFGKVIYAQQILSFIAFLLFVVTVIYIKKAMSEPLSSK